MERRAITIGGTVQGVGFRPFVYRTATALGLRGYVQNRAGMVYIDVEGNTATLDRFMDQVRQSAPAVSRIESFDWQARPPAFFDRFSIDASMSHAGAEQCDEAGVFISPDIATCPDCLAEMEDPGDRRFGYPFSNCTNCGPRLTIIRGAPYDRCKTTMAGFTMCPACRREYEGPANRRFHAQPTACPECGPRLEAVLTRLAVAASHVFGALRVPLANGTRSVPDTFGAGQGMPVETPDPLGFFAAELLQGKIGALKGLGGYHLVCDARRQDVVCELRRRKQREEMPLAVMVRDIGQVAQLCHVSPQERALLESPRRPIVLLRKWSVPPANVIGVCEAVAPRTQCLGIMLPYTPLHHLLLAKTGGIPLVMTSGNRSHEHIAYLDDDAVTRLGDIADVILRHNRPIHVRCDDSVVRIVDGAESPVRRSRGYAPMPVALPMECPLPILAVGGQFKGVFALGRGKQAILSHHMGDLDQLAAYRQFERDIGLYEELFQTSSEWIVHDMHPDYAATTYAKNRAERQPLKRLAVQHHHAHMASCMAENQLTGQVIGVTFDGTGYGIDEDSGQPTIWGGEFLVGDYLGFHRAAHMRNVPLPGGDAAVREPWRMAASHLLDAGCGLDRLKSRIPAAKLKAIESMLATRFNSPLTSSMGRLFDAVASIAGVRDSVSYEGQAAMQLEWLAADEPADICYPFSVEAEDNSRRKAEGRGQNTGTADCRLPRNSAKSPTAYCKEPAVIDSRPLIAAVAEDATHGASAACIARRFHSTLVAICVETCQRIRRATDLNAVVLSGGVFMNALLSSEVNGALNAAGFAVFRHRVVPPNDAGLALGQLAAAAAHVCSVSGTLRVPMSSGTRSVPDTLGGK